jgi:hypothetical protein
LTVLDFESQLNLLHDSQEATSLLLSRGGTISCDRDERSVYWLCLRPASEPSERYVVRLAWDRYPHDPPSVKFATDIRGQLDSTGAWPIIAGYRPGNFDICQPFTKEAFAIHPEWKDGPERWPANGRNPFLWVVVTLQNDFDNRYEGRSG